MLPVSKLSPTSRSVCLASLIKVFTQNSYSSLSLGQALDRAKLKSADRRLATRLFYGTIQYRLYLAYQLRGLVKTKLKEDYLRPLLLMSLYQLLFMDKIPQRAVLDEANKLAKQFGKRNSRGFRIVNGILRAFLRRGAQLPAKTAPDYLSVKYSYPQWLVDYLLTNFGQAQAVANLASCNQAPCNCVRVKRQADRAKVVAELKKEGYGVATSPLSKASLRLTGGSGAASPLFQAGQITIQDEAAALPVQAFSWQGTERVLDACAAPGGKTEQIAEHLTTGQVVALDLHANKLRLIQQNAQRMGQAGKVQTLALDARKAGTRFAAGSFDKILVDAPCSGLGLLRRKPEIRYAKSKQDLEQLAQVQLSILQAIWPLLRAGGELVYSTCTISCEEDEQVSQTFLAKQTDAALASQRKILPADYGSDGFFIARFTRRG